MTSSSTRTCYSLGASFSVREVGLLHVPFYGLCCTTVLGLGGTFCSFLHLFKRPVPCSRCEFWLNFCLCRGNFTVPKLSDSNMGFGVLGVFLGLLLEVSTHGPNAVPRTSWKHQGEVIKWTLLQEEELINSIIKKQNEKSCHIYMCTVVARNGNW